MARFKDQDWKLPVNERGNLSSWDLVPIAVLMDIRDELKKLNRVFECPNFIALPRKLDAIAKNTKKPIRKKKVQK